MAKRGMGTPPKKFDVLDARLRWALDQTGGAYVVLVAVEGENGFTYSTNLESEGGDEKVRAALLLGLLQSWNHELTELAKQSGKTVDEVRAILERGRGMVFDQ